MQQAIVAALVLLATINAPLAARAQTVTITTVAPHPIQDTIYTGYFWPSDPPVIWVNPQYVDGRPEVLAPYLAHELTHYADYQDGAYLSHLGGPSYAMEVRAFVVQTQVYYALDRQPPDDKPSLWNARIAHLVDNDQIDTWVRANYQSQCEPMPHKP